MRLALDRIHVGKRVRQLDPAVVDLYAEAIGQKGDVDQPLLVRPLDEPIGGADHELVAGGHRYAAARKAGLVDIEVTSKPMDARQAWLAQIDENLIRADLKALDRAIHLAERKRVYEELHPETTRGGDRRSKRREEIKLQSRQFGFSEAAAAAVGLSERTIYKAVALAETLGPDIIDKLRGSPIADNASELEALAKLDPAKREKAVEQLAAGEVRLAGALNAAGLGPARQDAQEQLYRALLSLWSRANAKTRERFLAHATGKAKPGRKGKP